jgi:hypothetical protein
MRNARQEAAERIGRTHDVRVLEPSPPAVQDGPFFADDPVAGGEVVPVQRKGTRTWADLCAESSDPDLEAWCADRWLISADLESLPATFAGTRSALHAVAEHVIAPVRHAANGKIGLRFTYRGFGTPAFGDDRQVRVEDGVLVDGDRRHEPKSVGDAADFIGIKPGAPEGVYKPSTACEPNAPLTIDTVAARALGDWYGFCASTIEQLREDATRDDAPARVQIWPEHFDIAVDLGPDGERANYGGSPGDAAHPEPYLYIGPFEKRTGDFWNEPFGASLLYSELVAGADALEFFREGRRMLTLR